MFLLLAIAAFLAAPVSAQGGGAAPSGLSLSPAGQAILKAEIETGHPELMAIIRKLTETRKRIDLQLRAERPDWTALTVLLDQDFADQTRLRRLSQTIDRALLLKLSETDRVVYLRGRFPPTGSMPVLTPPKR